MSNDRRRQIISIGSAVIIHIIVLVFLGMNRNDYETIDEFGPITVEISLDKQPVSKIPEPEAEQINTFDSEEAPPVAVEAPEPIPAAEIEPESVPVPVPEAAVAVAPVSAPRSYAPAAVDNSFLETLKKRSSVGGVDARAVFGDDPVPSSTDRLNAPSASGADEGSEVFLTDSKPALVNNDQPDIEDPSDMSVIEAGDLSSLDRQLSAGSAAELRNEKASSVNTAAETAVSAADVSGQSRNVKFNNPALSRELLFWAPPEIPSEVQTTGISKYIVVIEFDIDSDGITSGFRIKQTSADTRIDAAVQKALRGWVFEESSFTANKKVRATLTYVIEIK